MTKKMHYSNKELILFIVQDLISDIRFSTRKIGTSMNDTDEANYRKDLQSRLTDIFRNRHTVRLDRNGWPILKSFISHSG